MTLPPCIRHGTRGIQDPRIKQALAAARDRGGVTVEHDLVSLVDYDGQLWATWRNAQLGQSYGPALADAWSQVGGERGALHLVRIDEDFDYQEDCMNEAAEPQA